MTGRPRDTIITAPVAELLDPEIHTPPRGVQLLVVTRGGVVIKARQRAKAESLLVRD